MKSYNLELLKLSGIDFVFKTNLKQGKPANDLTAFSNQALPSHQLSLSTLKTNYSNCQKCPLHETRKNFLYGTGNPQADIMIISDSPSVQEDLSGNFYAGPAGELLTKMLTAIKIEKESIYYSTIVKCRPPNNRTPLPNEKETCLPYLLEQINIIKPKILILLGKVTASTLFPQYGNPSLDSYREKELQFYNIRTFVTYHPETLLSNAEFKLPAWHDLQHIQHYLENN